MVVLAVAEGVGETLAIGVWVALACSDGTIVAVAVAITPVDDTSSSPSGATVARDVLVGDGAGVEVRLAAGVRVTVGEMRAAVADELIVGLI